jgi:hypothetical protein
MIIVKLAVSALILLLLLYIRAQSIQDDVRFKEPGPIPTLLNGDQVAKWHTLHAVVLEVTSMVNDYPTHVASILDATKALRTPYLLIADTAGAEDTWDTAITAIEAILVTEQHQLVTALGDIAGVQDINNYDKVAKYMDALSKMGMAVGVWDVQKSTNQLQSGIDKLKDAEAMVLGSGTDASQTKLPQGYDISIREVLANKIVQRMAFVVHIQSDGNRINVLASGLEQDILIN